MNIIKHIIKLLGHPQYDDAIQSYNQGWYAQAIEKFDAFLDRKHGAKHLNDTLARFYCGQAHRKLGQIFFAAGQCSKAVPHFEAALKFQPDKIELYQHLGACYGNLGQPRKAYAVFSKILMENPALLSPHARLEIIFQNLNVWNRAIAHLQQLADQHPRFADIRFNLGLALLGKGRIREAAGEFEAAVEINPHYSPARIKAGVSRAYIGCYPEAVEHLEGVLDEFPTYADVHFTLGIVHLTRSSPVEAVRCFEQALEINPNYTSAKVKLGLSLCQLDDLDRGVRTLRAAAESAPHDNNLRTVLRAISRLSGGQTVSGRTLTKFLEWYESQHTMRYGSGSDAYDLSIGPNFSNLLSVIKTLPADQPLLYEKLLPLLKETIRAYPAYSDIHNSLGTFYLKSQKYDLAIGAFKKAKQLNPNYLIARVNLFNAFKEKGDFEAALQESDELSQLQLSYPDFYCAVAEAYLQCGKAQEAANAICRILEQRPAFAPAHFLLAQIYLKSGDMKQVTRQLRACLDEQLSSAEFQRARTLYENLTAASDD